MGVVKDAEEEQVFLFPARVKGGLGGILGLFQLNFPRSSGDLVH